MVLNLKRYYILLGNQKYWILIELLKLWIPLKQWNFIIAPIEDWGFLEFYYTGNWPSQITEAYLKPLLMLMKNGYIFSCRLHDGILTSNAQPEHWRPCHQWRLINGILWSCDLSVLRVLVVFQSFVLPN